VGSIHRKAIQRMATSIMEKLKVSDRTEAVATAFRHGVLSEDDE
jgi:DNA-binding NarL/FixJ family response regulator